MIRPVSNKKTPEWLIPAGLILLSLIPIIAGVFRMTQLGKGLVTPENERFFVNPLPVILHIISFIIYCLIGAFQFSRSFRQSKPKWHRRAGKILIPAGLMTALTGLWMTQFYPSVNFDGPVLYFMRLIVGSTMILFIGLAIDAIRKRDFPKHGAWMIRAYALALGAGTQVLTHIPFFIFPTIQGEATRALFMGLGWGINLVLAEWIIQRWLHIGNTKIQQAIN